MIRKKLAAKSGFNLTELIVTIAIVSLLGLAVAVGISAAARAYTDVTMSSEASVLSGTLAVELADELRFAENISGDGDEITFSSRRFGNDVSVDSENGRVTVGGNQILANKAYTGLNAEAVVSYANDCFGVVINISSGSGRLLGTVEFSVKPLSS